MINEEVKTEVIKILSEECGVGKETIALEDSLSDTLGLTSLDIAFVQVEIEKSFGIDLPEDNPTTVEELILRVQEQIVKISNQVQTN